MSFWDYVNERHSEMLSHTHRSIRHGIVTFCALALGACLKMPLDAFLGNDVKPEQSLVFVASGVAVSVVYTAIALLRGPQPRDEPELHLTDEMRQRIR